jgi:hypothetical protein
VSPRLRALLQDLALASGTVVVFLLLLEGAFRLAGDRLRPELASRRIFDGR